MNQQIFSPEDVLSGNVVIDEFTVEQKDIVQKFLEDKFSSKIDAIVKDFDDDKNEDYSRTYLERRSPLQFSMSVNRRQMGFFIRFYDTEHSSFRDDPPTKFNEVVIYFQDGETTRTAYGKKFLDTIQRKRKIKYISKLEPTIIEILDKMVNIASEERVGFLETKEFNRKRIAQEKLESLKDDLEEVRNFEKKYEKFLVTGEGETDFREIYVDLNKKINAEKARLKEAGLL